MDCPAHGWCRTAAGRCKSRGCSADWARALDKSTGQSWRALPFFWAVDFPKIISGGQTGADRAALDWAMTNGIAHGGWCPKGRLAEDGMIDARYDLRETPKADYLQRTEWNVRDSDATVIISLTPQLTGGSLATAKLASDLGKPCLHLSGLQDAADNVRQLAVFLHRHEVRVLNVAGPRASGEPHVGAFIQSIFLELLVKWE